MNTKYLKVVTTAVKVLSVLAGLASYSELIPAKLLPVAGILFAAASAFKDLFVKAGDLLDDGQANNSFKG